MKATSLSGLVLVAGVLLNVAAQAEDGPFMMRARVLDMQVENGNSPTLATPVTADNKVFPEVDFSWFWTRNIATELILTYPQAHTVRLGGTPIGGIKQLPPTLTVQYHFIPEGQVRPYVGVGVNYTRFMDENLLGGAVTTDSDSFGLAAQAGVDFKLAPNWYVNLDAKYVQISTNVKLAATGETLTKLTLDPWLLSVGVGYRF